MEMSLKIACLVVLATQLIARGSGQSSSGSGPTTRYWDCCKPSCAWPDKATTVNNQPVYSCAKDGYTVLDPNIINDCGGGGEAGGPAFTCAGQQPWAINSSLAFGFAAYSESFCCGCFELTFTSGPVVGQIMVVQTTNSGSDLGANQFDLEIPGGGVGIYNGCTDQYNAPPDGWGDRYGGVHSEAECNSELPSDLQPGCDWRFEWFKGADNPNMNFRRVQCPRSIINKSGCERTDDSSEDPKYANM